MTPQQEQLLEQMANLLEQWNKLNYSDRYVFQKTIQIQDGRNIQVGQTTGTKIGLGVNSKLGFFGNTPVVQQNAINSPSGGLTVDSQARSAIDSLIAVLANLGLTAT